MHVLAVLLPSKCTAVHADYMVVDAVQKAKQMAPNVNLVIPKYQDTENQYAVVQSHTAKIEEADIH